jgi:hypothetical protein
VGLCGVDYNCRRIRAYTTGRSFVGEVDLDRLFGANYITLYGLSRPTKGTAYAAVGIDREAIKGVEISEGFIYRVKGL